VGPEGGVGVAAVGRRTQVCRRKNSILLINTRHDPADRSRNVRRAERLLGNAVLLTSAGYGHPTSEDPSRCIERWRVRFLAQLRTPRRGTVGRPDRRDPDFGRPLAGGPAPWPEPPGDPVANG
jgi:hypothetical protein